MFYVNNNNTKVRTRNIVPAFKLKQANNIVPSFKVTPYKGNKQINIQSTLSETTIIEGVDITKLVNIKIDNYLYDEVTDKNNLNKGKFYIDYENELIYLKPIDTSNFTVNITLNLSESKFIDNALSQYPELLKYKTQVSGLNITRNFEGHPRASLSFSCDFSDIKSLRDIFFDDNKKWVFYNIPFRVSEAGISESINKIEEYPHGFHNFSVSFEGWYRKLVSKNIFLRANPNEQIEDLRECYREEEYFKFLRNTELYSKQRRDHLYITIKDLAARANVSVYPGHYKVYYHKETSKTATTTLDSELKKVAEENNLAIVYSEDSGIRLLDWKAGKKHKIFDQNEFISKLNINYKLNIEELNPTNITWIKPKPFSPFDGDEPKIKKLDRPERTVLVPPNGEGRKVPKSIERIKDVSMTFDNSGERSTQKIITYKGDIVVREQIEEWGLEFLARDVYVYNQPSKKGLIDGDPNAYWKKIKYQDIQHIYDYVTGYYLGSVTKGWYKARFSKETENVQTVRLTALLDQPEDLTENEFAAANGELSQYIFKKVPINAQDYLNLAQHMDYYKKRTREQESNAFKERFIIWEECNENNKTVMKAKPDPRWIPSMFVKKRNKFYSGIATMPNPYNIIKEEDENAKPKLSTGEEKKEEQKTFIYKSRNYHLDGGDSDIILDGNNLGEDKYLVRTTKQAAQDYNFKNSAQDTNDSESTGKPGKANQVSSKYVTYEQWRNIKGDPEIKVVEEFEDPEGWLDKWKLFAYSDDIDYEIEFKEWQKEQESNNNTGVITKTNHLWEKYFGHISSNTSITSNSNYKSDIPSVGYNPNVTFSNSSWHFEVYTMEEAKEQAKYRWEKEKFYNSTTYSFKSIVKLNYKEGDYLDFKYGFEKFNTRMKSISHTIGLAGTTNDKKPHFIAETTINTVKYPIDAELKFFKIPEDEEKEKLKYLTLIDDTRNGFELGQGELNFPFRRRGV